MVWLEAIFRTDSPKAELDGTWFAFRRVGPDEVRWDILVQGTRYLIDEGTTPRVVVAGRDEDPDLVPALVRPILSLADFVPHRSVLVPGTLREQRVSYQGLNARLITFDATAGARPGGPHQDGTAEPIRHAVTVTDSSFILRREISSARAVIVTTWLEISRYHGSADQPGSVTTENTWRMHA